MERSSGGRERERVERRWAEGKRERETVEERLRRRVEDKDQPDGQRGVAFDQQPPCGADLRGAGSAVHRAARRLRQCEGTPEPPNRREAEKQGTGIISWQRISSALIPPARSLGPGAHSSKSEWVGSHQR